MYLNFISHCNWLIALSLLFPDMAALAAPKLLDVNEFFVETEFTPALPEMRRASDIVLAVFIPRYGDVDFTERVSTTVQDLNSALEH